MMPAFNAETYVGQAIESILAQTNPNWELVIVDDGSVDRTRDIASHYKDTRIQVIHQENGGESIARNTAIKHVRGEFLAFLDADDLYLPNHLRVAAEYLTSQPQVNGVYTDGYYIDQTGKQLQTLSSRRRGPFEGDLFEEVVYGSDVFGPPVCVVLRTNLIKQYNLSFDENIIIGPDWDFFTKYAEVGNFGYRDEITCLYRLHTTNISVRTGLKKRALELAKCRKNAIKMKHFNRCSDRVRTAVFYDLLINLLIDLPEQQTEITHWQEFAELPNPEQARLLRLMVSTNAVHGYDQTHVQNWLDRARQLNPSDWRAAILWFLFRIHPKLLRTTLKIKKHQEIDPRTIQPFADMNLSNRS
jgi:glycosyltransferase involved in cell wall biosynthesis